MPFIAVGAFSYVLFLIYDINSVKANLPALRLLFGLGTVLLGCSSVVVAFLSRGFAHAATPVFAAVASRIFGAYHILAVFCAAAEKHIYRRAAKTLRDGNVRALPPSGRAVADAYVRHGIRGFAVHAYAGWGADIFGARRAIRPVSGRVDVPAYISRVRRIQTQRAVPFAQSGKRKAGCLGQGGSTLR